MGHGPASHHRIRRRVLQGGGLGAACEPAVLRVVGRKCPELLPDVLAGNEERGWLLLADHGTPLWTGVLPRHQVAEFERLLPAYARLQASTVDSVDELLANGVPTGPTACPPWSSRSWPT